MARGYHNERDGRKFRLTSPAEAFGPLAAARFVKIIIDNPHQKS